MSISTRYTQLLGIQYPIVQDGLGLSPTAKLAAAVSAAGGLGSVSIPGAVEDAKQSCKLFREQIDECASLTDKPFAVNIPVGRDSSGNLLAFSEVLLDLVIEARKSDSQLERQIRLVSTSAGSPLPFRARLKDAGLLHQHKVGTTEQAKKAAEAGVDVITAMGAEAGAHISRRNVHTFVLVPNVLDAVDVPVLLSGGVRDGRGLAAALAMGAVGVTMGTRFLVSYESTWHPGFSDALIKMREGDDIAFAANYGNCRGLRNKASLALIPGLDAVHAGRDHIHNKLESMRRSQDTGETENSLVLTGQVASGITERVHVSEFVPAMAKQAEEILASLGRAR